MKMNKQKDTSVPGKGSAPRRIVRSGRPPKELAGQVEERILDAAREVFLERGFEGASIDEIAEAARSGKPTIYARFPNKQALFTAAVTRFMTLKAMRFESYTPAGITIEERLASIGVTLLQAALTSEGIGLVRLAIAEAHRFPVLGSRINQMTRERGVEIVVRLLGEVTESLELGKLPAFGPETIPITAGYFMDLIFLPMLMRALSGENLETLRAGIGPHVSQRAAFFLAACRHGGIR
jgi:AcrR family transcriptional regulator